MKKILTIIVAFICLQANGQNLVPNPSFENSENHPCEWYTSQGGFNNAMENWFVPTQGTSDIFSTLVGVSCYASCFSEHWAAIGQQMPRTGDVMSAIVTYGLGCGFQPDYREYLAVELEAPLVVGSTYYAEVYVSHGDYAQYASNNIGMYFSETAINMPSSCTELNFTPHVVETSIIEESDDWVKVSGTFVADSPAQYLIIGNFTDNDNTTTSFDASKENDFCTYFVDDVLVRSACSTASTDTSICLGETITLQTNSDLLVGWAVDTLLTEIISTDSILTVSPESTTSYFAYGCDTSSHSVVVNVPPTVDLGIDISLCNGETFILDATTADVTYLWQDNSIDSTFTVTEQGTYWVEVNNSCGIVVDSIEVIYSAGPLIDLGADGTFCQGDTFTLDVTTTNGTYLWQDNSTQPSFDVTEEGMYWVEVTNDCGITLDTISLSYGSMPFLDLGKDTTLCEGVTLTLDVTTSNTTYFWQDESTNPSFTITEPGTYWVEINNNCGTARDSIDIGYILNPTVDLGNDATFCEGDTVTLDATTANATYLWQDNSTDPTFTLGEPGTYWVEVDHSCGIVIDTIIFSNNSLTGFNLGNDTTLCQGETITLDATTPNANYLWQDNSSNPLFTISESGTYWVEVDNNCELVSDTLIVEFENCDCSLSIPSAFTPNSDGSNDNFSPLADCNFSDYSFMIFNRWGEMLFESNIPGESWDGTYRGTMVPIGVYVYVVNYSFQEETETRAGNVTIVR